MRPKWLRTLINLPPEEYLKLLANAACAVGNSRSFVRDASYFGTPVVLAGHRQEGRETDVSGWLGVDDAWRIIDDAIAETREAIASDPQNPVLVEILSSHYERKVELLQRASELAPSS